jgi:AraC-like DNA-binding protein/quercetin dioxygenase-like cupin family protein
MSRTRQNPRDPDGFPVRGLAVTYPDGYVLDRHSHPWAQLVYACSGAMRVSTPDTAWLVPPTRAIWVPGGTPHEIRMRGRVAMRTLYLAPTEGDERLAACRAIEVAPLLRELILHIVNIGMLDVDDPGHARLEGLLTDLLAAGETPPLELPLPVDARARAFADRLLDDPASDTTLADRARGSGASLRTLQRLFLAGTGLSLETWRSRARMQQAVVSLSGGAPITAVALAAGYQSASAFIAAFKRTFGVAPGRWRRGIDPGARRSFVTVPPKPPSAPPPPARSQTAPGAFREPGPQSPAASTAADQARTDGLRPDGLPTRSGPGSPAERVTRTGS